MVLEDRKGSLVDTEDEVLVTLPRRHRVDEEEMDITPMIDITFLLLIFFLVGSRLQTNVMAELPVARYGEGVSGKTAVVLTVTRGPGETDLVFRGDTTAAENRVDAPSLEQQEVLIGAYVEQQFAGGSPDVAPKEHVLIKAGRDVRSREVARVARAASRADVSQEIKLYVAVREVER